MKFPSMPNFLSVLSWKDVGFCSMLFLSLSWLVWFLSYILLVGCIALIDWVLDVKLILYFWEKSHLVMVCKFFVDVRMYFSVFCLIFFFSIYKGYWSGVFLSYDFVWFWFQSNTGLTEWIVNYCFVFWRILWRIGIWFLKNWKNSLVKLPWLFLCQVFSWLIRCFHLF